MAKFNSPRGAKHLGTSGSRSCPKKVPYGARYSASKGHRTHFQKNEVLAWIVLILVCGSLVIAVIDENQRVTFADLAKVGVGGYIGWVIPQSKVN